MSLPSEHRGIDSEGGGTRLGRTEVPPGSNGLLALPYFPGERTPISDPHARGVIAGLSLGTTRSDPYRALLEATAYGMRHLLESIAQAGATADRYVSVGGGTKGGVWTQIVSDVCNIEQDLPSSPSVPAAATR